MDALTQISLTSNTQTPLAKPTPADDKVKAGAAFTATLDTQAARSSADLATVSGSQPSGWKQLETLLVQQMLQSVMTSEEGGFFGEGLGSDYYQSFMVEQFATRLAEGLDLGIASRLDRHYGSGDQA